MSNMHSNFPFVKNNHLHHIMSLLLSGGYKGYGLGMMVEVFCGILAGAQYSRNIRTWKETDRVANLVCLFLASIVF